MFIGVVAQGIKSASKRFIFAKGATLRPKVITLGLDADAAEPFLFFSGQGNFEGGITGLNVTATLAFGAVVKQHASTPSDTWCEHQSAHGANKYKCHQSLAGLKQHHSTRVKPKFLCGEHVLTS
ncbi:MAG: hypothetical protein EB066_07095 [Betaproteobacteria bacterium]|nr:hypothetical protein [Betaproteobacteria bacterium]NDF06184.1 hypothetical protein [Betaproteobacteria bacterium]